jgi:predicted secreted protein
MYEQQLAMLRIELYAAVQRMKGRDLDELRELITEIAATLDACGCDVCVSEREREAR